LIANIIRFHSLAIAFSLPLLLAPAERDLNTSAGGGGAAAQAGTSDGVQVADNTTPGNTGGIHDDKGKCGEGCLHAHNGS